VDVGNWVVIGLVGLVAINYLVPRIELVRRVPALFWAINVIDLVVGLAVLLFGVPGFESHPIVRFMIGLLVLMHLAQNFALKSRWESEDRMDRLDEELRARMEHEDQEEQR
jgi:uncharacterized protein YhhL (DUF1145 family)